jgi:hypothetical protein
VTGTRLSDLSRERRLALGLFLLLLLAFYGLAQVKLLTSVGGERYPGPAAVLAKYHGDPKKSVFHKVLDPALPVTDPRNMFQYLGGSDEDRAARRTAILAWVDGGAPREGWLPLSTIFTGDDTCAMCHSTKGPEPRARSDLPFETYDQVVEAARRDTGMSIHDLATSSHNHMMGFAVVAILASWIFTATRWRGPLVPILVAGAFVGAAVDVGSWWLTRWHGSPFQYGVILGGGAFGACVMAMVVLSLDELWLRGGLGSLLARATAALRLGRRDAA